MLIYHISQICGFTKAREMKLTFSQSRFPQSSNNTAFVASSQVTDSPSAGINSQEDLRTRLQLLSRLPETLHIMPRNQGKLEASAPKIMYYQINPIPFSDYTILSSVITAICGVYAAVLLFCQSLLGSMSRKISPVSLI